MGAPYPVAVTQPAADAIPETASWARRILALVVDWLACTAVVMVVLGPGGWLESRYAATYTLLVYLAENTLLTATMGGSFGQLLTRLRVVRIDGRPVPIGPLQAFVRSLLICLVIPPLVFRPDGRGFHDMAAGSAVVPFRP